MKGIKQLIERVYTNEHINDLKKFQEANDLQDLTIEQVDEELSTVTEYVYGLMTGTNYAGESVQLKNLDFKESLGLDDIGIVLKKTIKEILQMPIEPDKFLTRIATPFNLGPNDPWQIEFPSVGAVQAGIVSPGGDYPSMVPSFSENKVNFGIKKVGIMMPLNEETQRYSMYSMLNLGLTLCKNAVERKIEGMLYNVLTNVANVIYDNASLVAKYHTSGKAEDGTTKNYTYGYKDLYKQCGALVANTYQPTHVLAHPLAYPVFVNDPFLKATFMHQGQIGGNVWSKGPDFDQNSITPFGLTYVPYYALAYNEASTLTAGPGSGLDETLISDFYVIDANHALYLAKAGEMEVDNMEDWYKDVTTIKVRQYTDAAAKDGGKPITVAKNIRVDYNNDPIMTIRTV